MSSPRALALILIATLAPGAAAAPTKKAGKSRASTSDGPDLDAAARREIQCPKGFVPEKSAGPHLVVADKTQKKAAKGRKKAKGGAKTHTLSRRCVPDPSLAKPAANDDAKSRRTAAEALRD